MKKSMVGWVWSRFQSGSEWDGFDEKDQYLHASGLSDIWTGMFMIVWYMTARCPYLLGWLGLMFWL